MARRKSLSKNVLKDLSQWNFVLFLTLSLLLIVGIVYAMGGGSNLDFRSRARSSCYYDTTIATQKFSEECREEGKKVRWEKVWKENSDGQNRYMECVLKPVDCN